ncbi:DUF362 domain-containing protein [Chloroflexi bacterium TSY]|nr:DUF362 domain-containing protein [Chloroflexi bacterium TSY]
MSHQPPRSLLVAANGPEIKPMPTDALELNQSQSQSPSPLQSKAVIVKQPEADKFGLLEAALEQSDFWLHLERTRQLTGLGPAEFLILIKPDMIFFDEGVPTGTDPRLVEHLIDLLHKRGYAQVIVAEGRNSFDLWLENREVVILADMVGYRYVTEQGNDYDVVDLSEQVVEAPFPPGTVLHGSGLAQPWLDAHYRISFAKNKTDEEDFYALGLANLLGVLPLRDKEYHYRHRFNPGDACLELLQQTPVHFSLIDATISNHGSGGVRIARPLVTNTVIASDNLLLADWVGALKMGLDPFSSTINTPALRRLGLPPNHKIEGSVAAYHGWRNVSPLLADSVRRRNQHPDVRRLLIPWLQVVNHVLFPFKELINEQANRFASKYFANIDENPLALWGFVGLNYVLGGLLKNLEAYQTLYDKDRLRWKEAPLNLDPVEYPLADYEAIIDYLSPLAELVHQLPSDANGMRWRYLEESVIFEFSRQVPVPYDDFVGQVDISKSIQFMNDYIGGVAVPVAHDGQSRVTHQVERNLYLPQPNYLVLYEGQVIDVTKLEYIIYEQDAHQIFWKTVNSENDSAVYDDGIVTFSRIDVEGEEDETQVTIFGRQLFNLPPFWQMINLDLYPPLKDFLVAHAYTTFFKQTMANFEAKVEGRQIRIGRPWHPQQGEQGFEAAEPPPTAQVGKVIEKVSELFKQIWPGELTSTLSQSSKSRGSGGEVDADGFVHFKGNANTSNSAGRDASNFDRQASSIEKTLTQMTNDASHFWTDLVVAMDKDASSLAADGAMLRNADHSQADRPPEPKSEAGT